MGWHHPRSFPASLPSLHPSTPSWQSLSLSQALSSLPSVSSRSSMVCPRSSHSHSACRPSLSLQGVYLVLFADCVKVLINKRRRRAGGNVRLILISSTLFILITWVRLFSRTLIPPPRSDWLLLSMKFSMPFVSTWPTRPAKRIRAPTCITSMSLQCSVS